MGALHQAMRSCFMWNRLMHRCTFTDKCSGIYVELGHKWEWTEYHWRKSMR